MGITLDQLLASREQRWTKQKELIRQYPDMSLICLTITIPGNVKRNHQSLIIAKAAVEELKKRYEDCKIITNDLETGFEAYLLTAMPLLEAKKVACDIEENHPLGRLFDIDVIDKNGNPIPRKAIGGSLRRCLICNNEARFCMRNHTHTQEEILQVIDKMTANYVQ